jgi:cathepsin C
VYNQGCDGGYVYLVGKFFKEFAVVPEQCFKDNKCDSVCTDEVGRLKLGASDYYYVGGSYGKSSEEAIMLDLYKNGPLALSFNPDSTFSSYRSGVYSYIPERTWIRSGMTRPEWVKVDHSMTLVGWGEEEYKGHMVKYWLLQNSWGASWGDKGYIKFHRGDDLFGIESIGEAMNPWAWGY